MSARNLPSRRQSARLLGPSLSSFTTTSTSQPQLSPIVRARSPSDSIPAPPRKRARLLTEALEERVQLEAEGAAPTVRLEGNARATATLANNEGDAANVKPKKQRKKKAVNPLKPSDFPPRVVSLWKVGAHVSAAGGVENAIANAAAIGANAFALFLKSQRQWSAPPLATNSITAFKARLSEFGYAPEQVLPHGSYLVNLGNADVEKREKSYACFLDELQRCEQLGLVLYNFHPGSTVGAATPAESLALIAACINRAHKDCVVCVLENTAGAGNVLGAPFSQLGEIIRQVEDKSRVGVCLDTCHAFAAGYDIRTKEGWEAMMVEFEREIGVGFLRGMHLNDSKAELGSHKDRHENIGLGHLGLQAFAYVLGDPRTQGIPLVLETPNFDDARAVWATEIAVLNRLSPGGASGSDTDPSVAQGGGLEDGDGEAGGWTEEIRQAVVVAKKAKDAKEGVKKARKSAKRGDNDELDEGEDDASGIRPVQRAAKATKLVAGKVSRRKADAELGGYEAREFKTVTRRKGKRLREGLVAAGGEESSELSELTASDRDNT